MQLIFDQRFRKLVDFLSLDSLEIEEQHIPEKIMFLYDWAEKKGQDVFQNLQTLKKQTGATLRGKPLLIEMYKMARLDAEKIMHRERQKLDRQSLAEKEERVIEARKKQREREKLWNQTKDQMYEEKEKTEKDIKRRVNIFKRVQELKEIKYQKADIKVKDVKNEPTEPEALQI